MVKDNMNRKEIYSSKTYEIYLNLINKHMNSEYKPVIITSKFDKLLEGKEMKYNSNTERYEYFEYKEDIGKEMFVTNDYKISLSVPMVEKYVKEGVFQIKVEEKLYSSNEEDYIEAGILSGDLPKEKEKVEEIKSIDYLPKEDIKEWEKGYSYKNPTELEILRDEIDGLKSTIYNLRHQFETALDELHEEFNKYHNSKKSEYHWFPRILWGQDNYI